MQTILALKKLVIEGRGEVKLSAHLEPMKTLFMGPHRPHIGPIQV